MVKRKKYTEDLDIKITDDEDEQEDVDVTTTAAAVASISGGTAAQLKQEMELDGDGLPSMQFFVVSVEILYNLVVCSSVEIAQVLEMTWLLKLLTFDEMYFYSAEIHLIVLCYFYRKTQVRKMLPL